MGKRLIHVRWGIVRRSGSVLSVLAVLGAAAYASLPVWFPTAWFAARLERQLSLDLGQPVRLGGMEIGWVNGVVLKDLRIGDAESDLPHARIDRLGCALTPLRTLLTQRVSELEIERPELFVDVSGDGKLSWDVLGGKSDEGALPSYNFLLRDLACHVKTPRGQETIRMDRLECRLEPETGALRLRGEVRVDPQAEDPKTSRLRRLNVYAHALVPRLNPAVKLSGELHVEWTLLTLSDLPLRLVPALPVEQVAGTTSGSLELKTQPDLGIDYRVEVSLDDVALRDVDSPRSALLPDAMMSCSGHWDPPSDLVDLHGFEVRTPGLSMTGSRSGSRSALSLDLGEKNPAELHVSGTVNDWLRCRDEWPPLAKVLDQWGVSMAGSASFAVDVSRRFDFEHLLLKLDLGATACRVIDESGDEWIDAPEGKSKTLETELTLNHEGSVQAQGRLALLYGPASLALEGTSQAPLGWLEADARNGWERIEPWVRAADGQLSWKCEDITACLRSLPGLKRYLDGLEGVHIAGPGRFDVRLKPTPVGSSIRLAAELPQGAELALRDAVLKRADRSLAVYLDTAVPIAREATIRDWRCSLAYGDARVDLGGAGSELGYRCGGGEASVGRLPEPWAWLPEDVRFTADVAARRVEECLELLPRAAARLAELEPGRLTGGFRSTISCSLSRRPHDLLAVTALDLDATELGVQLGDWVSKPRGEPLQLTASHRLTNNDAAEHVLSATIAGGGGSLETAWAIALDKQGELEGVYGGWLQAGIRDIAAATRLCPIWGAKLAEFDPQGGVELNFRVVSTAPKRASLDHLLVDVEVDATDLEAQLSGRPLVVKRRDVPLKLALHGAVDTPRADEGSVFNLASGFLQCGETAMDTLRARLVFDRSLAACWPRRGSQAMVPRVVSGHGELDANLRPGRMLRGLNPELAGWCDYAQLSGEAQLQAHARWDGQRWQCTGQLDGRSVSFDVPTVWPSVPRVAKHAGLPVMLEWQIEGGTTNVSGQRTMEVKQLRLALADDELTTAGTLGLNHQGDRWAIGAFESTSQLRLVKPEALIAWLPGSMVNRLNGRMDATLKLAKQGDSLVWGPLNVDFKDFDAVLNGEAAELDGHVTLGMSSLLLDPLVVKWGASDVTLSGSLYRDAQGQGGRLVASSRSADVPRFMEAIGQTSRRWGLDQGTGKTTEESSWLTRLIPELARTQLRVDAYADTLQVVLPPNQSVQADALVASLQVEKGPVTFTFNAVAGGGSASGQVTSQTQEANPTYRLTYKADSLRPGPLVDGYLRQTFPGMTATGNLTLIDESTQKLFPAPGKLNAPVGKGELIIHGGYMVGRATPNWVVNIFPGLNLSRYDFTYMHSWFEKFPTGRTRHQMIYQGTYYNVYMIGYNDPDHSFEYEVGIDFLADFDSKYWAESGQGRIPLFVKTGKVAADGSLAEEDVTFASPQRTLETLLLSNNPVITAYYAVRKRVLGE